MKLDKNIKRPFSVENYNPEWIDKFKVIQQTLKKVFANKALSIEHIGSTSIIGTKAKPLIDVLVVVEKMESFEKEIKEMEDLDYSYGENYIAPDTILFFKENEHGSKTENIHVCEKDSPKAIQFITTRDYLRAHPERATQYGDLKELNAIKYADNYPEYRKAKQDFIDETERLTQEWLSLL